MRKSLLLLTAVTLTLATFTSAAFTFFRLVPTGERMTSAATNFLQTLDDEQRKTVLYDYDSEKRVGWHFIPLDERKGMQIKHMNDQQRQAAHALLRSALSQIGYDKATGIMELEKLLKHVQTSGPLRDHERYYVSLFGEPKPDARWGFSFEGHHLSLNFVVEGDLVISNTPQVFATNPAQVKKDYLEGFPQGLEILKAEEELAFQLVNALSDEQRKKAVIAEKSLSEIRAAGQPHPPQVAPEGIAWGDLNEGQQQTLRQLIDAYITNMPQDVAAMRHADLTEAGWDTIHFAWAGGFEAGIPHYYRVQGKTFLIEFVNAQPDVEGNPANHIHCVWRDMRGDFALSAQ